LEHYARIIVDREQERRCKPIWTRASRRWGRLYKDGEKAKRVGDEQGQGPQRAWGQLAAAGFCSHTNFHNKMDLRESSPATAGSDGCRGCALSDTVISDIDREVGAVVEPFRTTILLLTTIPGVDEPSACVILAEIGRDMSRFPTAPGT